MDKPVGSGFKVKVKQKDYVFVPAHDWAKVCLWMVQALLEVPYSHPSCPTLHKAGSWVSLPSEHFAKGWTGTMKWLE